MSLSFYACGGYIRHGKSVCRLGELPQDLLEEEVVRAIGQFNERYVSASGERLLVRVLDEEIGSDAKQNERERNTLAERIAKIDQTSARLLDQLSEVNRPVVDRRLAELARQREALEAQTRRVNRLAWDAAEAQALREQTLSFVRGAANALNAGSLSDRQASLRRYVESISVDYERRQLHVAVRPVPLVAGGTCDARPERLALRLTLGRGARASPP